jgi:hypothetical protein
MATFGWIELREKRFGAHLRDLIEQDQGTEIGAIGAGVIADWRRAARIQRIAVPEVPVRAQERCAFPFWRERWRPRSTSPASPRASCRMAQRAER